MATIYLVIYGLLVLGAFSYSDGYSYSPGYFGYVFVRDATDHALALLVIPGIALLAAGTLFQLSRPAETKQLVVGHRSRRDRRRGDRAVLPARAGPTPMSRWSDTLVLAARITAPELAVAAVAVYVGRRFERHAAYIGGIILTGADGPGDACGADPAAAAVSGRPTRCRAR